MTEDAFLWAILALLSVALVVQIITVRRGPWSATKETKPLVIRVPKSFIEQVRAANAYPLSHVTLVEEDGELRVEATRWTQT